MLTTLTAVELEVLLTEALYGFILMSLVAIFDIYVFIQIALAYRRTIEASAWHSRHYEMLRFIGFVMLLIGAMIFSLFFWAISLSALGFVSDWVTAFLFSASFFTSVGNFAVSLPVGWRLVPSLIAFSGLFSFAWATATSMAMARSLFNHLDKHKQSCVLGYTDTHQPERTV